MSKTVLSLCMKKNIGLFLLFVVIFGCGQINAGFAMGTAPQKKVNLPTTPTTLATPATSEEWSTLVSETNALPKTIMIGSWDPTYWIGASSPGRSNDFKKWGLNLKTAHPEFFTTISAEGILVKPGYQDNYHRGAYSIDYPELLRVIKELSKDNLLPTVGLFIHNFESVNEIQFEKFFAKLNADLVKNKIPKVVLIPAWDIQGEWTAWQNGATRNCYIDPVVFNRQMPKMRYARNRINAKNIVLGVSLAAGFDIKTHNKQGKSGIDYLEGIKACDIIGINAYPSKAIGPKAAFDDAKKLWVAAGSNKPFAFFEYSIDTNALVKNKPVEWTSADKINFIKTTYALLKEYPFVKQIDWWFIGKGPGARLRIDQ